MTGRHLTCTVDLSRVLGFFGFSCPQLDERMTPPIACQIIAWVAIHELVYYVSRAASTFLADAP